MWNWTLAIAFFVMILAPCGAALLMGRRGDMEEPHLLEVAPLAELEGSPDTGSELGMEIGVETKAGFGLAGWSLRDDLPRAGSHASLVQVAEAEELIALAVAAEAHAAALAASARTAQARADEAAEAAGQTRREAEEAIRAGLSLRTAKEGSGPRGGGDPAAVSGSRRRAA